MWELRRPLSQWPPRIHRGSVRAWRAGLRSCLRRWLHRKVMYGGRVEVRVLLLLLLSSYDRHRARGKVHRGVSFCVAVWSGTPFLPPVTMCVVGSSIRRSMQWVRIKHQLYSGKIDVAITGRRPFLFSSSLARRKRRICHRRSRNDHDGAMVVR